MTRYILVGTFLVFISIQSWGAERETKALNLDKLEGKTSYPTIEEVEKTFNSLKSKLREFLSPEEFERLESAFKEVRIEPTWMTTKLKKGEFDKSELMTTFNKFAFDVTTKLGRELKIEEHRNETIFDDIWDFCDLANRISNDIDVDDSDLDYGAGKIYWNRIIDRDSKNLEAYVVFVYMPVKIRVIKENNVCNYPFAIRVYEPDETDPDKTTSVSFRGSNDPESYGFKRLIDYMKEK